MHKRRECHTTSGSQFALCLVSLDHIRSYNVQMSEELKSDVFYLLLSRYISKGICAFLRTAPTCDMSLLMQNFFLFFWGGGRASLTVIFYNRENIFKTARHVLLKKKRFNQFLLTSVVCLFSSRSLARIIRSFNIHMYII